MSDNGQNLRIDLALTLPGLQLRVDQDLRLSGVTALFGPSGAGKSTLLRAIAGLERRTRGTLSFRGASWQDERGGFTAPEHRRIGYVFQDARLFEHLSIADNLSYGRKRRPGGQISPTDVEAALDLRPLLTRPVSALSGGERQRVALGRALLSNPELLLLDEPLAALDLTARRSVLGYLERVFEDFSLPAILVSHSPEEVRRLCDHVVLLENGTVSASGRVDDILQNLPHGAEGPLAEQGSVLTARLMSENPEYGLYGLDLAGQALALPVDRPRVPGRNIRLSVMARDVALALKKPQGTSVQNILEGQVQTISPPQGPFVVVTVSIASQSILARITRLSCEQLNLRPGDRVFCLIKSASMPVSG